MARWLALVVFVVAMTYAIYRIGISLAVVRADRAGDDERAQQLRKQAFGLRVLALGLSALLSIALVVVLVAKQ
jgi:hypothetical protein